MREEAECEDYADLLRDSWWAAVATLTRMFGDLEAAEDAGRRRGVSQVRSG